MFENGCYLRRQKRFKIPKADGKEGGRRGGKEGRGSRHHHNNNHHQSIHADSTAMDVGNLGDTKKSSSGNSDIKVSWKYVIKSLIKTNFGSIFCSL